MIRTILITALAGIMFVGTMHAQPIAELKVDVNKPVADIQPTMWGIFFEDINFAADGGIYAEMIKNRSFEFENPLMGWLQPATDRHSLNEQSGFASVMKEQRKPVNRFARITVQNAAGYTLINEGFRGMGVKSGEMYDLTLNARLHAEGIKSITFQLVDANENDLGSIIIPVYGGSWKEYAGSITVKATEAKAQLKITFEGTGVVDMDMISLFPRDTWMGRPKGLRKDLVQLLADLNPGFLRFPGGCIVEGRTLDQRYQWKKTVGDIESRTLLINRWNTEFAHRPTPDYFQSFGLGFYEYFQLAEDLGAEPLPILGCGMACQFNTGELVPLDELDPYVQDALDLIEFANGPVTSTWGKLRADMGHEKPFGLKYLGIGNEQWGREYFERLEIFINAIKAKYPEIIIVSGTGPNPDGEHFEFAEKELERLRAEIVDEHYYRPPQWFLDNAGRYDSYDRNRYKIFAGEYAAQSTATASPLNKNNWHCAMAEAAFLTGLERNADVVWLTSYAPLFAHVDGWQWTPDLIWFDNLKSFGTPNYYVQKLFATNAGTKLIPVNMDKNPVKGQEGLYASSVLDEQTREIIVKVVNSQASSRTANISLNGVGKLASEAQVITLTSNDLEDVNSLQNPENIAPKSSTIKVTGKKMSLNIPAYALLVLKVKMK